MGGKGQVALFVLAGLVLVIIIVLAISLVGRTETTIVQNDDPVAQANPELAAEIERMQVRVDECLGRVTRDALDEFTVSGVQVDSIGEAESLLADEVAARFPECYFQYNTWEKLAIADNEPGVTVTLGPDSVLVSADYAATGTFEEETYRLEQYIASTETSLKELLERGIALRKSFAAGAPGGLTPGAEFIDEDCNVDLYAYEEENIYADLVIREDGTMAALFYDYNPAYDGEAAGAPQIIELGRCER